MKFALAGNPNCGKTTLFNTLTGSTAHVGNWAGVTVDKREGTYKKLAEKVEIVDLPGIYSLSPYTPEEVVSRNFILDEKPDCIINVVDATNLERNLYLTTQVIEIDVPVVIALNMIDAVKANGDTIDVAALEKKLGVPVVAVSALKGEGVARLMQRAYEAAKKPRKGYSPLTETHLKSLVESTAASLASKGVASPLFHAAKLVEGDEIEKGLFPEESLLVKATEEQMPKDDFDGDFEAIVADQRYQYISDRFADTVTKGKKKDGLTRSDKIDKVLTHRIWSIPIFLAILFVIFHLVFGESLFYISEMSGGKASLTNPTAINVFSGMGYEDIVADAVAEAYENEENSSLIWVQKVALAEDEEAALDKIVAAIVDGENYEGVEVSMAIPCPGVFLQNWMGFVTGSVVDFFSDVVFGAEIHEGTWYKGLICDGVFNGLDAVCSFIPQIMLLFLFMAIMEDSGYMARVAFIMDRAFRKFGLSGKAFIPLLMGFGCSVPAMMATKTLEEEKERDTTIRLAPFFSCGAKAPIWAMLAGVAVLGSLGGGVFVFCVYLLGIVVAIVSALFIKLFSKAYEVPPFIMELPAYHLPQARNVGAHLWEKLKHYVKKAGTIITAALIVTWFLSSFGWAFWKGMVDIEESIIADIGRGLKYFFWPCGWAQGEDGWRYAVSAILGLVAKEDVVAQMAQFGLTEGSVSLTAAGVFAFAAYNLLTFPCFAAIATARGESTKKGFTFTMLFWFFGSYLLSALVYWVGHLLETVLPVGVIALVLVVAAIVALGIVQANRQKKVTKAVGI